MAIWFAVTLPAVVKLPAAWSAGPLPSSYTASSKTVPSIPLPKGVQVAPSHLAMRFAATPLTTVKLPPT